MTKKSVIGKPTQKTSAKKYGQHVIDRGFTIIPSTLFECQERLKLNGQQLALLCHLLAAWWAPESMPWPSKETLSKRMGISPKQVQRHMRDMEQLGLLQRKARFRSRGTQTSNLYDLSGLVSRLQQLASELDEADQAAEAAKSGARRPGLKNRSVKRGGQNDDVIA